jgi:hypothetical protein
MKLIFVKSGIWKKKGLVLIEFPFGQELVHLVKQLPEIRWNPNRKAWMPPFQEDMLSKILATFNGKAWVDFSQFKKILPEELPANLPELSPELAQEIRKFTAWMKIRRFTESTVKTYSQSLSLFFRFMENENPEEITSEN